MNRIFKAFFNRNKCCCVVSSEHSKAKSKIVSSSLIGALALLISISPAYSFVRIVGVHNANAYPGSDDYNGTYHLFNNVEIEFTNYRQNIAGFSENQHGVIGAHINQNLNNNSFSIGGIENMPDSQTVYFGYGDSYGGFFRDLKEGESVGFVDSISAQEQNGNYSYTIKYSKVSKDENGKISIVYNGRESFTCSNTDSNCPIFTGSLDSDDREKIQEISSQISNYLTGNVTGGSESRYQYNGSVARRLTGVAKGEISADSYDAINGSQLYELQQQIATGGNDYLSVNASDEEASPSTSAKAIGARSTALGEGATAKGSQSLAVGYKASVEATNSVALGANSSVFSTDVLASDSGVVSVGSSDESTGFKRRIINVADGINDSDAATVGQVGSISRSNIKNSLENILGVTVTDNGTSMTAGNIGQTGQTTVSGAISSIKSSVDNKLDLNLGNLSQDGKNEIAQLAQSSVKVNAGNHVTVSSGTDGYTVSVVADGTVKGNTDEHLVTGATVATAIDSETRLASDGNYVKSNTSAAQNLTLLDSQIKTNETAIATKANNDATGINLSAWQNVLGDGSVEADNKGLVTGGTVYDAISNTFGNLDGTLQGDAVKDQAQKAINVKAAEGSQYLAVTKTSDPHTNVDTYAIGLTMADQIGGTIDGLVTSSMVFGEVRPAQDGAVIRRNETTGANLTALDTSLATLGTNFGNLSTTVTNLQSLQGLTTAGETKIKDLASNSISIIGGDHVGAEKSTSNGQVSWTLNVDDSGTISEDSDKLVTGQTVYNYVKDFTTGAGFATISGDNIEVDNWISVLGTAKDSPAVSASNNRFITGSELFSEVHLDADGNYVKTANTVAGNLTSLDSQLGLVSQNVFDSQGNLALATRSLDNLSDDGLERLKSSVGVIGDGTFITVSKSDTEDGNTRNYSLSLKTTENAAEGENALVTSNTLGEALKDQDASITEGLALKADIDAKNLSDENVLQWQSKLGNGLVAADNLGLITGGVLFNEVRPTEDGSYISSTQTTAANLVNLDKGLDTLDQNKANVNADNIVKNNWITALGGSIAADQTGLGFVTGNAIYQWGTPENRDEPYYAISSGYTVGQNLVALDDKLSKVQQSIPTNALDTSLSNLTESGKTTIGNIAYDSLDISGSGLISVSKENGGFTIGGITAGEVAQDSSGLVTGDQVWDALQGISISEDAIQEAINNALTNSDIFQDAVSDAVVNNSNVQVAINNALNSEQTLNNIAQNMKPVGQVAADDDRAVSGKNVYNYLHSDSLGLGAGSTASGTNAFVFGQGSTVSANNAGVFGTGNSVAANNSYAFGNNNKIANGAENSFALGNNNTINEGATNTFILGSNVTTSAQNAVVLGAGSVGVDNAVSVGSSTVKRKVVNVAAGDVSAGSTDAVNGGQLYETQQAIAQNSRSIRQVAHSLKKDINRAAANAAAMAALQPLGLDEDHKWSAAAGVGNYSGEQALAVGVFYKPTENVMVNFGGSAATGGDAMVNAGIAYRFGAPSSYNSMSTSALKSKVVALSDHNRSLEMQLRSAQIREQSMAEKVSKSQKELEDLKKEVEMMKRALGLQPKAMKTNYKSN